MPYSPCQNAAADYASLAPSQQFPFLKECSSTSWEFQSLHLHPRPGIFSHPDFPQTGHTPHRPCWWLCCSTKGTQTNPLYWDCFLHLLTHWTQFWPGGSLLHVLFDPHWSTEVPLRSTVAQTRQWQGHYFPYESGALPFIQLQEEHSKILRTPISWKLLKIYTAQCHKLHWTIFVSLKENKSCPYTSLNTTKPIFSPPTSYSMCSHCFFIITLSYTEKKNKRVQKRET